MDSDWIFFLKQKTAYEMRISDWSSDVCSSDLVHHFALLGGYGAEAIHPYLALESLGRMADPDKAAKNFIKAIGKGLNKVMSKMGISTYMSYTGAQIFEAVGLQRALVDKYFTGTASNIEGIGIFPGAEEAQTGRPHV